MSEPLTFGSLFAGIGGMDLGLERAGLQCRWQVEIDGYARRVLAKHWPDVRKHDDVRTFPPNDSEDWHVDVIAGGFPCQDISFAGKGAGLSGERSGLWFEYARIIRDLQPRYVVVENVAALLVRGLDAVLGTLVSLGYDAEWESLPASAFGAPHIRDRVFIVAYSPEIRRRKKSDESQNDGLFPSARERRLQQFGRDFRWPPEPDVRRVDDGFPSKLDSSRLGGLGNAVVPQVAEFIGRRLIEFHQALEATDAE